MKITSAFVAFMLFCSAASAVSFDCKKAASFVEKAICSDPTLGKLDDVLSVNYKGMLGADFGGTQKSLRDEQLKWIRSRNTCTDNKCLVDAYRKRIDETCDYGVVSGSHPECTLSEALK